MLSFISQIYCQSYYLLSKQNNAYYKDSICLKKRFDFRHLAESALKPDVHCVNDNLTRKQRKPR